MWRKKLHVQRTAPGEEGQGLVETAIVMPLLFGIAFNMLNWGYFWFMVLALSAAPRQGVQYATQGGTAIQSGGNPSVTNVYNLVNENLTNAISGTTSSVVSVQVCSKSLGVNSTTHIAQCQSFGSGPTTGITTPPADPEAPAFVLDSVDVAYTVTPIIPGRVFTVVLPSNMTFHRKVYMRSLF
jgi:hypothetical protein